MKILRKQIWVCALLVLYASAIRAQTYELTQTAVASGGGAGAGDAFTLDSTAGQAAAGAVPHDAQYAITIGFWSYPATSPTGALAVTGGRVATSDGRSLAHIEMELMNLAEARRQIIYANRAKRFAFADLPIGQAYVIPARRRHHVSKPESHFIPLLPKQGGFNFTRQWPSGTP